MTKRGETNTNKINKVSRNSTEASQKETDRHTSAGVAHTRSLHIEKTCTAHCGAHDAARPIERR